MYLQNLGRYFTTSANLPLITVKEENLILRRFEKDFGKFDTCRRLPRTSPVILGDKNQFDKRQEINFRVSIFPTSKLLNPSFPFRMSRIFLSA
ncbi:hypothetical protein CDAR_503821 [Caerostris darwini]|uniref:Uncharacterized protein n=1 Tax=Caerostris darwini TaxID=1538125 RepID=A0AAV4PGL1_9ARAC|nr:hypothetical protein CDAR_503821 [Caerostris darwini]